MSTMTKHRGQDTGAAIPAGHKATPELMSATELLEMFKSVSQALGEIDGQDETLLFTLRDIATRTGWPVGHIYFVDETEDVLAPSNLWHLDDPKDLAPFQRVTAETSFARSTGMPGKVWATGKPMWIADVTPGPKFPRAAAAYDIGLVSGFGFPLTAQGKVLGVAEFFSTDRRKPDDSLMECLAIIGGQLGRMVQQYRSNATIKRQAEVVDQVEEIIAIADSAGVIFDCNESFQRTFGLAKDQIIGHRTRDFLAHTQQSGFSKAAILEDLKNNGRWHGTLDFEVADQSVKTFDLNVALYTDPTTKAVGRMLVGRDITESLRTLDSLRLSNAAIEATDGAVLIVEADAPHRIVFANPAFERMLGYTRDEIIGAIPSDITRIDNYDAHVENVITIRDDGGPTETIVGTTRKDGTSFKRHVFASPIRDASGAVTHFISISKDVTEDTRQEDLLKRQAAVMRTMGDAVLITEDGIIQDCNVAYAELIGAPKESLIGVSARNDHIWPSGDTIEPKNIIAAVESDGTWPGEQRLRRANGDILTIESRVSSIADEAGCRKAMVTVCRDITARRTMENSLLRQEAILSNIKEAMLIQSTEGIILECNDAATKQYGYTRDELIGMNSRDLLPPHFQSEPFFEKAITELMETGHWTGEIQIVRKDGVQIDVEISSTLLKDHRGNIKGWVELNRDITERKALEKELKLSRAALEATDVAVVITDAVEEGGPITYVNPAFESMMGYARQEVIGNSYSKFIPVGRVHHSQLDVSELSPGVKPVKVVALTTRKDGQKIIRNVRVAPIFDNTGTLTNWLSLSTDVTKKKEREGLLQRQAAVMQTMADAVIVTDESGLILDCNQAYAALLGCEKAEIIGSNAQSFTADGEFDTRENILEAIAARGSWFGEGEILRRDGQKLIVEARLTLVADEGAGTNVVVTVARDVTTQRQMENYLERQAATLKNIKEAMLVQSAEGIVVDCNDAAPALYGYSKDELIGMRSHDLAHPDFDVETIFKTAIPEIMATGNWSGELEIQTKDGAHKIIESSSTVLKDRDGNITGWVELTRDITERKQVENTRKLQALVMEQLDESVVVLDLGGLVIECNEKSLEMYGYTREELLGASAISMLAFTNDEEKTEFRRKAIQAAQEAGTVQFTTSVIRKDGVAIDAEVTYSVLRNESGSEFARLLVSKDVTAAKQAQRDLEVGRRRLEAVIAASGAGIWEQDSVTGNTFIGPVLKDLSGYGEAFTNDIKQWRNLVNPEDLPIYDARYKDWDGRIRKVDAEYRIITKAGDTKWIRSRGEIVGNENQEMIWGIGLGWDVTEEKLREKRQEELEKRFMQSQKMETLGTLTGGIAHDFNNILTPILGYAHLAQADNQGNDAMQTYLERIVGGAERAKELIQRILTFSRHIEPKRSEVDIESIAAEVGSLIEASAPPQVNVQVTSDGPDTSAMVDGIQIHQALMNLCTNGLQAIGESPGILAVHVGVQKIDQNYCHTEGLQLALGRYVRITVQDSGGGIDPEIAERIFEPFFTTRAVDEGTGLGLSVVHGIIEAHGGTITLDPSVNLGAKFEIYLPTHTQGSAAIH